MPVIYCKVNLFDATQTVLLVDDKASTELAKVEMNKLAETIATVCNEEKVYDVKLYGNVNYCTEISWNITMYNGFAYANEHEIKVEVIEE